jgi:Zn-dependent metalloprotease
MRRVILDALGGEDAERTVVARSEGGAPVEDRAVNDAFDHFADLYEYFRLCHFRDSLDGAGGPLVAVVHAGPFENAHWVGGRAMIGDSQVLFHPFTSRPSVIYQLGVTGLLDCLDLPGRTVESEALRIAAANIFACLVRQFTLRLPAAADTWVVGEKIFRIEAGDGGMSSLRAPGTASTYDSQIARLAARDADLDAYTLSGVPAHAFYRFATDLGGYAWEAAGQIWYAALTDRRARKAMRTLAGFGELTVAVADELYGHRQAAAAASAWDAVEVAGRW